MVINMTCRKWTEAEAEIENLGFRKDDTRFSQTGSETWIDNSREVTLARNFVTGEMIIFCGDIIPQNELAYQERNQQYSMGLTTSETSAFLHRMKELESA